MMRPETYFRYIYSDVWFACEFNASRRVEQERVFSFFIFVCSSVLCLIRVSDALLLMSCHDMRVRWNVRANVCNQLNVLVRLCGFCLRFFRILPHFDLFAVRIETYWRQSPSPLSSPNRFVCCAHSKHYLSFMQTIVTWKCIVCHWQTDCASAASTLRQFQLHMFIYLMKIDSKAFSDFWCSFFFSCLRSICFQPYNMNVHHALASTAIIWPVHCLHQHHISTHIPHDVCHYIRAVWFCRSQCICRPHSQQPRRQWNRRDIIHTFHHSIQTSLYRFHSIMMWKNRFRSHWRRHRLEQSVAVTRAQAFCHQRWQRNRFTLRHHRLAAYVVYTIV